MKGSRGGQTGHTRTNDSDVLMHDAGYEPKTDLDARPGQTSGQTIVWYDGSCPLCRREIDLMRRLNTDDAVRFCDLDQTPDNTLPLARARLLSRFHVQGPDQQLVSGAAGFVEMWRALPPLRPLAAIARQPLLLAVLERLYLVFLSLRPLLQRLVHWFERRRRKAAAATRPKHAP